VPPPGYQGICYPASCNGEPDKDPLYVSKRNAIPNFTTSLNPADWSRQVPIQQLPQDLARGHVPAFNWVIPVGRRAWAVGAYDGSNGRLPFVEVRH
jgi:hypothetical protein